MRLRDRQLSFDCITHHARVTQCLGAVGAPPGTPWYLGVAAPSLVPGSKDGGDTESHDSGKEDVEIGDSSAGPSVTVKESSCGHQYLPPPVESVRVFRMEGPVIVKLHRGTWHAGPLFTTPAMDFYNLELADTNVSRKTVIGSNIE